MSELFKPKVEMRQLSDKTELGQEREKLITQFIKAKLDERLLDQSKEIGLRNMMKRVLSKL